MFSSVCVCVRVCACECPSLTLSLWQALKVLNPHCQLILRVLKIKIYSAAFFCCNNTKCLHTIAEISLHLANKKLSTYVYLESDTTCGNIMAVIRKFIVTKNRLQIYTPHTIKVFVPLPMKINVPLTPSNATLCDTLQSTALYEVRHLIFGSTL
jgi:hypothetical protein